MSLKRAGDINQKGARDCLKCGTTLTNLKDDVINKCDCCGQEHFVDIVGHTLTLTVVEKPALRRRPAERQAEAIAETKAMELAAITLQLKRLEIQQAQVEEQHSKILKMLEKRELEIKELKKAAGILRQQLTRTSKKLAEAEKNAKEWEEAADGLADWLAEIMQSKEWQEWRHNN